jgi:hypothetical protein
LVPAITYISATNDISINDLQNMKVHSKLNCKVKDKVQFHTLSFSAPDGGEWPVSCPATILPAKEALVLTG